MEKTDIIEGLNVCKILIFVRKEEKVKKAWLKKDIRKKFSRLLRYRGHHKYRRYHKGTVPRDFRGFFHESVYPKPLSTRAVSNFFFYSGR
jgi:hypothetical protein